MPLPNAESNADSDRRRALGIYYTPDRLARVLAEWAIRDCSDSVLEPSFGGCSMLTAAVDKLRALSANTPQKQLYGYDVDAQAFVHLKKIIPGPIPKNFVLGDFLNAEGLYRGAQVKAVIGNPPFVSYHRMDANQRNTVKNWRSAHSPVLFHNTASLWAYFLLHALNFLETDGRLAFVLPAAFNTADYAKPLVDSLAAKFRAIQIFDVAEQMFLEAGTRERTVVLLAEGYSKNSDEDMCEVQHISVPTIDALENIVSGKQGNCEILAALPRSFLMSELQRNAGFIPLGRHVTVSIGEVVGDTRFLVKSQRDWSELGIPSKYLVPIVTRSKQIPGIVLKPNDVRSLYSPIPMMLQADSKRLPTSILNYLARYPASKRNQNRTFEKRDPWHLTGYRTDGAAFIGSLAHEAPRIILNRAKISCSNGLYQLRPQTGKKWTPGIAAAALSTLTLLSAELVARPVGPGAMKLEPSDVLKLLLPASTFTLTNKEALTFALEVDQIVRARGLAAATRHVDKRLLIDSQISSESMLREMHDAVQTLRGRRMQKRTKI